jgi:nucleoid-associated protein YejK
MEDLRDAVDSLTDKQAVAMELIVRKAVLKELIRVRSNIQMASLLVDLNQANTDEESKAWAQFQGMREFASVICERLDNDIRIQKGEEECSDSE